MIEPIARVRIELREIEPTLWRRVDVPLTSTLLALHDIIQATVGWTDSHLFEFVVGERVYSEPLPDDELFERKIYNAAGVRLRTLIGRGVERFTSTTSATTGATTSSSRRSETGRPTSTTRPSSPASGAARPKMSVASPASCSFSRQPSIRSTTSMNRC